MWDYDKLFAEGNIVGIKNKLTNILNPTTVYDKSLWGNIGYVDWRNYFNSNLSFISNYSFEIQYIIRLDEHGNVVEKLFDRDTDMKPEPEPMPELKDGMFIRVAFRGNYLEQDFGFISLIRKQIIYQHEGYDWIDNIKYWKNTKIIEIYDPEVLSFKNCQYSVPIWRSPEYQAYLDSKSN